MKLREEAYATRHGLIFRSIMTTEKNRAWLAGADYLTAYRLDEVLMFGGEFDTAHLTSLYDGGARAHKSPKGGK